MSRGLLPSEQRSEWIARSPMPGGSRPGYYRPQASMRYGSPYSQPSVQVAGSVRYGTNYASKSPYRANYAGSYLATPTKYATAPNMPQYYKPPKPRPALPTGQLTKQKLPQSASRSPSLRYGY